MSNLFIVFVFFVICIALLGYRTDCLQDEINDLKNEIKKLKG
jgi:hypothetical protein